MYKKIVIIVCIILVNLYTYIGFCENKKIDSFNEITGWIAYWEVEQALETLQKSKIKYNNISYFAAYYDDKNELYVPEKIKKAHKLLLKKGKVSNVHYLSIVNDVKTGKNNYKLKDIDVIREKLDGTAKQILAANDIINQAKKNGFTGIEIDYENIFRDKKLAKEYLKFINLLYDKATAKNIKLRIILEPGVKFSEYKFPIGPQYVVMIYNLYGLHSDPGPKADFEFIKKTIEKMKSLPGNIGVAFSTGGCMWSSDGKKKFISTLEAGNLAEKYDVEKKRDEKSDAISFSYRKNNIAYTVWYADDVTMKKWELIANRSNIKNISIWRIGN